MMGGLGAVKKAVEKAVYLVDLLEMTGQMMADLWEHERVAVKADVKDRLSVGLLGYSRVASTAGTRVALKADSSAWNLVASLGVTRAVAKAVHWAASKVASKADS